MTFLDDVKAQQKAIATARTQNQCNVALWLEGQPADVQADFDKALKPDSGYDATAIFRVLRARGARVPVESVRRHRRQDCKCFEDEQ